MLQPFLGQADVLPNSTLIDIAKRDNDEPSLSSGKIY